MRTKNKIVVAFIVILFAVLTFGTTKVQATEELVTSDTSTDQTLNNNSSSYNETDKQYILDTLENLGFEKEEDSDYYILHVNSYLDITNSNFTSGIDEIVEKIEEAGIVVENDGGSGGISGGSSIGKLYKSDVLYNYIIIESKTYYQLMIPANIEEEKDIEYAQSILKEFLQNEYDVTGAVTLEKAKENYYNIFMNGKSFDNMQIILNKEEVVDIKKEDTTTGVKLESTSAILPSNVVLSVAKVTEQNTLNIVEKSLKDISNEYIVYDITLLQDNVKVQPNGKVKISLPIPTDYDTTNLTVYRVAENGEKIEYKPTIETVDGVKYAIIETDHFSTYVLAEKVESTQTSTKGEKDETPKTGTIDMIYYILPITVISALGIVLFKKKH